jgi:hypothetical protein
VKSPFLSGEITIVLASEPIRHCEIHIFLGGWLSSMTRTSRRAQRRRRLHLLPIAGETQDGELRGTIPIRLKFHLFSDVLTMQL